MVQLVYELAGGDPVRYGQILDLPYGDLMTYLELADLEGRYGGLKRRDQPPS